MIRLALFFVSFLLIVHTALGSSLGSSTVDPTSVEELSDSKLLTFFKSRGVIQQGDDLTLFMQLGFQPTKNEFVLSANLDGTKIDVLQSSESLWAAKFFAFTEVKEHLLSAQIYIRDKKEGQRLDQAIDSLTAEIKNLNKEISQEEDLNRKAFLEKERDDKLAYLESLEEARENLKIFVKSESYTFAVEQNTSNPDFPYLTSITPAVGLNVGGKILTLSGQNFLASPIVKIGGVNATVLNVNATTIQIISPNFSTLGVKDIEVSFPVQQKNTLLKNAFTVTNQGILKNLRPVANAVTYMLVSHPVTNPITLDATASYDENGDTLNYQWLVTAAPSNSNIIPGTTLPNQPNPSVLPNKKGIYLFELKVRENNTAQQLESLPIHATLEVNK